MSGTIGGAETDASGPLLVSSCGVGVHVYAGRSYVHDNHV